ncbi:MAG: O-antigen ligase family protein [Phycisphaerae bacterium]|nr:O-antigen ligase family protein [Phycisphaerae bacterium]
MKKSRTQPDDIRNTTNPRAKFAETVRWIALALLLVTLTARVFIGEAPFITNPVAKANFSANPIAPKLAATMGHVDNLEFARVFFAVLLLGITAIWIAAGAIEGRLKIRCWFVGAGIIVFGVLSMLSAWAAPNQLAAWTVWLEQFALLAAGFTALQLCCNRRRFVITVVVLGALGVTLGCKGILQFTWEIPIRIEFFEANRADSLAAQGIKPGSPQEHMFAGRMLNNTTTGYLGLANIFAAELLVLLTAAIATLTAAVACRKLWKKDHGPLKKGEISLPTLLVWLLCAGIAAIVFSLIATRARGGIAAGVIVGLTVAAAWKFRVTIKRRWKAAVLVGLLLAGLGVAGVCSYGVSKDRLPSKTMAIRWFYWTGSAEIVREHPYLGVGPGNFSDAYVKVRRAEAEEEVKTPHNFVAHAVTQYGLPGGMLFVVIVIAMVVFAWRPSDPDHEIPDPTATKPPSAGPRALLFVAITAAMIISRWYFHVVPSGGREGLLLLECILPGFVLIAVLFIADWFATGAKELPESTIAIMRISLAAGASAFVIHNLVSYGLWSPGVGIVFWVAIGAAAAGTQKSITLRKLAIPLAAASAVGVIAAAIILVTPVYRKLELSQKMLDEIYNCRSIGIPPAAALQFAEAAADADKRDPGMIANVAKLQMMIIPRGKNIDPKKTLALFDAPLRWAEETTRRNPQNSPAWVSLGDLQRKIASHQTTPNYQPAVESFARAVSLNLGDARVHLRYAEILLLAGQKQKAQQQTDIAVDINSRLEKFDPGSKCLFGAAERTRVKELTEN